MAPFRRNLYWLHAKPIQYSAKLNHPNVVTTVAASAGP
jgi:hypothetical protein